MVIKWALAPVKSITSTAEEITSHHLDKRLPIVETGDEIASLSKTLNQMICRLDESFQSVNRFTADASHELRTPLTIIRGELETSLLDKSLSNKCAGDNLQSDRRNGESIQNCSMPAVALPVRCRKRSNGTRPVKLGRSRLYHHRSNGSVGGRKARHADFTERRG